MIPFPEKRYSVLYADPPWKYRDKANDGKRGAVHKYPVMTVEEIAALPVRDISHEQSVLLLWGTPPMQKEAEYVMEAWGFKYRTWGFLWVKTNKNGSIFRGMGHYTRANAEPCFLGIRGKPLPRLDKSVGQVVLAPRRQHSEKPEEVRNHIDRLYGDVPKLEMFARTRVPNWDAWGNEVPDECVTYPNLNAKPSSN